MEVLGVAEFERDMSRAVADIPKQVRDANAASAQLALQSALGLAQSKLAAKAAQSLSVIDVADGSTLSLDGNAFGGAMGAEFGGGTRPRTRQFPPWRGNGDSAGYFVLPGVRAAEPASTTAYEQVTAALADRVFP